MVTTHVHTESQSVDRSNGAGNGRISLIPAAKTDSGKLSRSSSRALANIWASVRGVAILAAVGKPVLAFHDWISDPPMTERDRIKHYIVETRKASKRRRLAGR